jgi:hypothetical protein
MNSQNKKTIDLIQESIRNQQDGKKVISLTDEVGNKTRHSEKQGIINSIKNSIFNLIQGGTDYPYIYSVVEFGFYDNEGFRLPYSEIKKYWIKSEVETTCRLIYNMLKEALGMNEIWMFIERHTPLYDDEGEVIREGRFHLNIITSSIPDAAVEEPNRKCRRLFLQDGKIKGVPIRDCVYDEDLEELKTNLFDACVRQANWVNRYKYSTKTQFLYEPTDLEEVVYYCLGDYKGRCEDKKGNKISNEIDFMDIIVWEASDFHKDELPLMENHE